LRTFFQSVEFHSAAKTVEYAVFRPEPDGRFTVSFPDLRGANTGGQRQAGGNGRSNRLPWQLWIADPPAWLEVLEGLDGGETAAIALDISLEADLLLMDDRKGVIVARGKGHCVTGTLGILARLASINITG
jgi:hypothetical protein